MWEDKVIDGFRPVLLDRVVKKIRFFFALCAMSATVPALAQTEGNRRAQLVSFLNGPPVTEASSVPAPMDYVPGLGDMSLVAPPDPAMRQALLMDFIDGERSSSTLSSPTPFRSNPFVRTPARFRNPFVRTRLPTYAASAAVLPGSMLPMSSISLPVIGNCRGMGYRPSNILSASAEARRAAYFPMIQQVACEHGLPVNLFDAMIIKESSYLQHGQWSSAGAYGLTQLMPDTAKYLGVNRYDTLSNLRGGAKYLKEQLRRFGDPSLALAAYNAGPARVLKSWSIPRISETQDYVYKIMGYWRALEGQSNRPSFLLPPSQTIQVAGATVPVTPVFRRAVLHVY